MVKYRAASVVSGLARRNVDSRARHHAYRAHGVNANSLIALEMRVSVSSALPGGQKPQGKRMTKAVLTENLARREACLNVSMKRSMYYDRLHFSFDHVGLRRKSPDG